MKQKTNMPLAGYSGVVNQDWVKNAVIYEVNLRQYTPAGTFNAFSEHHHSSWDNVLTLKHPDYDKSDKDGNF